MNQQNKTSMTNFLDDFESAIKTQRFKVALDVDFDASL
jgi:hypothetical protein